MTCISSSSSSWSNVSPADRMQTMLKQAVSAGTVKASDESALSSALTDIDQALKSSRSSASGSAPSSMKSKVDGLVDQEVSDGKLTTDQAAELKKVFATAAQSVHGGHGHMRALAASTNADLTSTPSVSATTGSSDTTEAITSLLKQLAQATSSATNYTAGGTNVTTTPSSIFVDSAA